MFSHALDRSSTGGRVVRIGACPERRNDRDELAAGELPSGGLASGYVTAAAVRSAGRAIAFAGGSRIVRSGAGGCRDWSGDGSAQSAHHSSIESAQIARAIPGVELSRGREPYVRLPCDVRQRRVDVLGTEWLARDEGVQ